MAGLTQAIRTFRSGSLSPDDFFARIDQALASSDANADRLLDILKEEQTNFPLPPDIYVEVQRRIENLEQAKDSLPGDETRVQTGAGQRSGGPAKAPAGRADGQPGAGLEPIKGVGDTLNGRFVLEECLGFGGMGMVYKALDLRKLEASDRKPYIAIKVLNVQFRGHPKSLIALQREAKKAQTLAHPNIVTVYDFDRDGATVYLTMEYLAGKPLSQVLRAPGFTGMPYDEALPIINGMAKALAYAHQRGFVHCDLKPANIFLTDSGEVKVIDFGIARVFQKPEEDSEATVFDPGSLGGMTPAYASPEMLEHRNPDPRDDIYAMGCITYELLSGHHPFDRLPATQARNAGMKPPRPRNLGLRQWRALQAALAFDRQSRTPRVAGFLQGINGERRAADYFGVAMAVAVVAGLGIATLAYYLEPATDQAGEVTAAGPPAAVGTPAAPSSPAVPPAPSPAAVGPLLAAVPCSALMATVRDDALLVQGYLPRSFGIPRLKEMLAAVPGISAPQIEVQTVSDNDCPVINAFAPYWRSNREAGGATAIRTRAAHGELQEGDSLILDIRTPGHESYVHIDYYALDGSVIHLLPSPRAKDNQAPPNHAASVGSMGNWVVAKPFGSELIVLVATPAPLFDGMRPEHESRAGYLQAVDQQLAAQAAKYGRDKLSADFVQITTRPKP